VEGSPPLPTERLDDVKAREVISRHNGIVRKELYDHDGYEVELEGDGFLLAFSSARRALRCAIANQQSFAAHSQERPETSMYGLACTAERCSRAQTNPSAKL
jgi:class 3 adenylate cyclase